MADTLLMVIDFLPKKVSCQKVIYVHARKIKRFCILYNVQHVSECTRSLFNESMSNLEMYGK